MECFLVFFFLFFFGGGEGGGVCWASIRPGRYIRGEPEHKFYTFISYEAFISEWVFINPAIFGPFRRRMQMKNGAF